MKKDKKVDLNNVPHSQVSCEVAIKQKELGFRHIYYFLMNGLLIEMSSSQAVFARNIITIIITVINNQSKA